ncbi:MAG: hypothetical protein EU548_04175, partial [Promethearchaeota archaeon]
RGDSGVHIITLYRTNNGLFKNNTIKLISNGVGLYLTESTNNTVYQNKFYMNEEAIRLYSSSNYNNISYNNFLQNDNYGIYVTHFSNYNSISFNNFINPSLSPCFAGIHILRWSYYNNVFDNYFEYHQYPIDLGSTSTYFTRYNNFSNNILKYSERAVVMRYGCEYNIFTQNLIDDTTQYVIYGQSSSNDNTFYKNYFLNYAMEPLDGGSNYYNNSFIGNYWDTYVGSDADGDGIGDSSYALSGTGTNYDYLPLYGDPFHNGSSLYIDGVLDNGIHSWQWVSTRSWCSGLGTEMNPFIIEGLTIDGLNSEICIEIENSDVYFSIENCELFNSSQTGSKDSGIIIRNSTNALVKKNLIYSNKHGIFLDRCNNSILLNNQIENVTLFGIYVFESENNSIFSNILFNNPRGLRLDSSHANMVNDNKILNSTTQGISLRFAHMNSVKSNEIKYNHFDGIYTYFSSKNNITQNYILHNQRHGMFISYNSTNNFIYQNEVIKNNNTGIYIIGTLPMNNTFWNNAFTENARHAFENGTLNFWDNGIIGNYWDNYTDLGSNAVDSNDDGIGDIPYILLGLEPNQDNLPIFWDAPILEINTPINDALYSFNAPQYSLTVEKGVAESIWYTYDDGITNITLPSLTGFLQEASWDLKVDEIIQISFFIKDSRGYIDSKEVTIEKDIEAPKISINSPLNGQEFADTTPLLDLDIDDSNLDSVWYIINFEDEIYLMSGSSEYLGQDEWSKLGNGIVNIRVYANDSMGNTNFEDVSFIKNKAIILMPLSSEFFLALIIGTISGAGLATLIFVSIALFLRKKKKQTARRDSK